MSVSSQGSTNVGQLEHAAKLQEKFKIVSKQSSARPGAIIELEPIADAVQDWQNTMLLQTFQEQVILSQGSFDNAELNHGLITSNMSAMVDLQDQFSEPFYVLLMEKVASGSAMMHMWRLVLSSEPEQQGEYDSSGSVTPDAEHPGGGHHHHHHQMSQVRF